MKTQGPTNDVALTALSVVVGICSSCAIDSGLLLMIGDHVRVGVVVIVLGMAVSVPSLWYVPSARRLQLVVTGIGVGVPVAWFLYELATMRPKFW